ncbi:hypothetical protein G5V59_16505 [Nocardioides sp. W3-2-3]|uniref:hypothetical protein n=1 Tax=Nocardioides convexus TaxID=2712224 RepID=UPI0024186749|nr:hypothetical protein [Nocardioides convexus]NHA00962.1 hypothetical protein [Nocardioides convexus]
MLRRHRQVARVKRPSTRVLREAKRLEAVTRLEVAAYPYARQIHALISGEERPELDDWCDAVLAMRGRMAFKSDVKRLEWLRWTSVPLPSLDEIEELAVVACVAHHPVTPVPRQPDRVSVPAPRPGKKRNGRSRSARSQRRRAGERRLRAALAALEIGSMAVLNPGSDELDVLTTGSIDRD